MKISSLSLAPISFECNGKVVDTFCIFNTEKLVSTGKFFLNKRIAGTYYARFKALDGEQYKNIYSYEEMAELVDTLTSGKVLAIPRPRIEHLFQAEEDYPHTIMWYDEKTSRIFVGIGLCKKGVEITDLEKQVPRWCSVFWSGKGGNQIKHQFSFEDVLKKNIEMSNWGYYPEPDDTLWRKTNVS